MALVAGVLDGIRGLGIPDACPGDWAWSVTALGVLTGLLPTAGALTVALLRRRIGSGSASGYNAAESVLIGGVGVLAAGLLPLAVFLGAGGAFSLATQGEAVPGLSAAATSSIRVTTCDIVGTQSSYLGRGSVAGSIGGGDVVTSVTAVALLGVVPLLAVALVAVQARTALRRGPRWPAKFFWLSLFSLIVLTAAVPAGTAEHLWVGILGGSLAGVLVVPMVPAPSRARIEQIRAGRAEARSSRASPAAPQAGTGSSRAGRGSGTGVAPQSRVTATPSVAERLAERFGRREPEHPVELSGRTAAGRGAEQAAGAPPVAQSAPYAGFHAPPPGPGPGGRPPQAYHGGPPGAAPPSGPGRPPTGPAAHPAAGPLRPHGPPSGGPYPPPAPPGRPPRNPTLVAPVPGAPPRGPRFRLLKRLGAGGFGGVWLAHDAKLGHTVAVKSAHAADPETEERIRREAAALGSMRHPCCVEIYDLLHASSDPGLQGMDGLVIVMQYVDGKSLGELVGERGPVDDISAARIWTGIAGALDTAHRGGVLHRDIKPGNIVVDPQGHPHLIDFGIARKQGDSTLTQTGYVLGTPDYLAPETAAGKPASPASDGWQLAAAVSFALSGHPPRGESSDAVAGLRAAAAGAKLTHLPNRTAHLSLLKQAMRTEPQRRPELRTVQSKLDGWLQRHGYRADGPVTAVFERQ
ncbi:Protein kinase domain-containing protein [Pseudonocardia ammonioxydans]|uniref:non-specific serine/threonine protein kinase n=1 Tax=Pseudonocardia ammonioxydans TaxID=260086 RepID=A0A1I4U1X2_PSUAM|nr:Protein kinase domain-containing protein [Pseudonocardia ammonioxydans]